MTRLISVVAMCAVALAAASCATGGTARSQKAVSSMSSIENEFSTGKEKIDAMLKALSDIQQTASKDARPAFKAYTSAVDAIEAQAKRVDEGVARLRANTQAHYDAWQKELEDVSNPELKARAESRRQQANEAFDRINKAMKDAENAYEPFIADARDIRTVLSNDLNPTGVTAVADVIQEVRGEGQKLKATIDAVVKEIESLRTTMTAAQPSR